jgi:LAO/AO transport system kinase
MGDSIQAIKAGILEIADLFVINKADREGADSLQKDLRVLMSLSEPSATAWKPLILQTIATQSKGISEMADGLAKHSEWLASSTEGKQKKLRILEHSIRQIAQDMLTERVFEKHQGKLEDFAQKCLERKSDPHTAALSLIDP